MNVNALITHAYIYIYTLYIAEASNCRYKSHYALTQKCKNMGLIRSSGEERKGDKEWIERQRERERKMRVREPSGNRYRKSLPKQLRKPEIVMVIHDQSHYTSFYISGLHHASEVVSLELPCLVAARSNLC